MTCTTVAVRVCVAVCCKMTCSQPPTTVSSYSFLVIFGNFFLSHELLAVRLYIVNDSGSSAHEADLSLQPLHSSSQYLVPHEVQLELVGCGVIHTNHIFTTWHLAAQPTNMHASDVEKEISYSNDHFPAANSRIPCSTKSELTNW